MGRQQAGRRCSSSAARQRHTTKRSKPYARAPLRPQDKLIREHYLKQQPALAAAPADCDGGLIVTLSVADASLREPKAPVGRRGRRPRDGARGPRCAAARRGAAAARGVEGQGWNLRVWQLGPASRTRARLLVRTHALPLLQWPPVGVDWDVQYARADAGPGRKWTTAPGPRLESRMLLSLAPGGAAAPRGPQRRTGAPGELGGRLVSASPWGHLGARLPGARPAARTAAARRCAVTQRTSMPLQPQT